MASKRTKVIVGVSAVVVLAGVVAFSVTKDSFDRIPVQIEKVDRQEDVIVEQERLQAPKGIERGPILICLDTSGSMHGAPETVAIPIDASYFATAANCTRRSTTTYSRSPTSLTKSPISVKKYRVPSTTG